MQESGEVCARGHIHAREWLFNRAGTTHALATLQHEHSLSSFRKIGRTGEPVVSGTNNNDVPASGCKVLYRHRESNLAEYRSCRRRHVLLRTASIRGSAPAAGYVRFFMRPAGMPPANFSVVAKVSLSCGSTLRIWRSRCGKGISIPFSCSACATAIATSLFN